MLARLKYWALFETNLDAGDLLGANVTVSGRGHGGKIVGWQARERHYRQDFFFTGSIFFGGKIVGGQARERHYRQDFPPPLFFCFVFVCRTA